VIDGESKVARETIAVMLGPGEAVIIPLADAIAEYFRLSRLSERSLTEDEVRILAALTLALGSVSSTPFASGVNETLRDAVALS